VISAVREMGSQPSRTAFRCPWQNGVAERWVGSCRRDLLDHVIILRATSPTADVFLPALLSRGPDAPILSETRRAAPSLCGGSVDSGATSVVTSKPVKAKSKFSASTRLIDESACNSKPKNVRQVGIHPFSVGHKDLANDTCLTRTQNCVHFVWSRE
jgi:hypothetical protein